MNTSIHFDFLILGAGLSGIGAACHLTRQMPGKRYAILDRRDAVGGTWDLFRYPGIRSDSDMTTFGYHFRPWNSPKMLADGPSIKQYVSDAAADHGVMPHIRFGREILSVEWSSSAGKWTVTATDKATGVTETYTAQFVISAMGYYNHLKAYTPEFAGREDYKGQIIHPQFWPEELDYRGKKVVIIGSGATAVTLVPTMAAAGADVTMLQRSPTYVISVPGIDPLWKLLSKFVPAMMAYRILRWRNVHRGRLLFKGAQRYPQIVRSLLLSRVSKELQSITDMHHFTPTYNPWEQRLCAVPDGDLFKSIRKGSAKVVTDHIDAFDATGIKLKSGKHIAADIIVTATGLEMQAFGGANVSVDGELVEMQDRIAWNGMMLGGVPNFMYLIGYSNASWTLKSDLVTEHFLRIVDYMDREKLNSVTPNADGVKRTSHGLSHFSSGYIQRGASTIPGNASNKPWAVLDDYVADAALFKRSYATDPTLHYKAIPMRITEENANVVGA